jgi:hypothetical protein
MMCRDVIHAKSSRETKTDMALSVIEVAPKCSGTGRHRF